MNFGGLAAPVDIPIRGALATYLFEAACGVLRVVSGAGGLEGFKEGEHSILKGLEECCRRGYDTTPLIGPTAGVPDPKGSDGGATTEREQ